MNLYLLEKVGSAGSQFGFLVAAKDSKSARKLSAEFANHDVKDFFDNAKGSSIRKIGVASIKDAGVVSVLTNK